MIRPQAICLKTILTRLSRCLKLGPLLFVALPSSTNYNLNAYDFSAGGTSASSSSNYRMSADSGTAANGAQAASTNYKAGGGLTFAEQANVPPAPTFQNLSTTYNKLHYAINQPTSSASDYLYLIAISSDNFTTTRYVQADHSVGSFVIGDYQSYASWGGSGGGNIIGLTPSTTYKIKVKAMHGKYTDSAFGPTASAATSDPSLLFSLATDYQSTPPFTVTMNDLVANTVVSSPHNVQVTFSTNAELGGNVYLAGLNGGLLSATTSHTIAGVSGALGSLTEGFGAQGISATQTSGGPFTLISAYAGSGDVVGIVDTNYRDVFTASAPVSGGQGSFLFKAKASSVTQAASDYTETLTVVASARF